MAIVTPEQYYSDEDRYGDYQFVFLKEVVDNLHLDAMDSDSFLKNTSRAKIIKKVKEGIKKISREVKGQPLDFEITVPDHLTFPLPQDYIDYRRVSVVVVAENGARRLFVLNRNKNIQTAVGYLQDDRADLLFDDAGFVLQADSSNAYSFAYQKYEFTEEGGQFSRDTSNFSEYGEFKIDKKRGMILFSSNLMDREIVFEYDSDGLQADLTEDKIRIDKDSVECITNWAYYACIETKRNIPANERQRALDRYKTTLHELKKLKADFDFSQIGRVMRSRSTYL